jgi:hypothetical protein
VELIGPYLIACALLVVAGVAKALRPAGTARALAGMVPVRPGRLAVPVRVGSVAEVALGLVALLVPRPVTALAVAVTYGAFAVIVAGVRARGGATASCGCFGATDTPATGLHVVIDMVLAASAVAVAASSPSGTLVSVLGHQPMDGLPLVFLSGVGAWLCILSVGRLADLRAARRLTAVSFGAAE